MRFSRSGRLRKAAVRVLGERSTITSNSCTCGPCHRGFAAVTHNEIRPISRRILVTDGTFNRRRHATAIVSKLMKSVAKKAGFMGIAIVADRAARAGLTRPFECFMA